MFQFILTPSGYKSIQDVEIGDEVVGFNYETKCQEIYVVAQKGPFGKRKLYINDDGSFHYDMHKNQSWVVINEKYWLAPHQSLYANGNVKHAFELQVGDWLEKEDSGRHVIVDKIERIDDPSPKILLRIEKKKNFLQKILKPKDKGFHTYYIDGLLVHNASRYGLSGNTDSTGTWSASSGGASGASVPSAADDIFFDGNTGAITVNASLSGRSINSTGYTGSLALNATSNIGDATAGASNIALKFVSGMTVTGTATINLISSSVTIQDVDFAGKTTGNVAIGTGSVGGAYKYVGGHTVGATGTVTLNRGTLDTNGQNVSWGIFISSNSNTRALTLGSSTVTVTGAANTVWNVNTASNITVSASSSTINFTGGNPTIILGNSLSYGTVTATGSGTVALQSAPNVVNFTRVGTATRSDSVRFNTASGSSLNISGTLTLTGNSSINRLLVFSQTVGTSRPITNNGTNAITNTDFADIAASGSANWDLSAVSGGSGDALGNTGITFTPDVITGWISSTGGNWSDAGSWSNRVPLPQDLVRFTQTFAPSQTVAADMPRLGRDIDWSSVGGNPTWNMTVVSDCTMYGSLTLASGMSISGNAGQALRFSGRSTHTITSNGKTIPQNTIVESAGGTYSFNDAYFCDNRLTLSLGSLLNPGNFTISVNSFASSTTNVRTLDLGSAIWNVTGVINNLWNIQVTTNLTFSGSNSTIVMTGSSSTNKNFFGGGLTYGTLRYTVLGTAGMFVTSSNSFDTFECYDRTNGRFVTFDAGGTTTIRGDLLITGGSGKVTTINTTTPGSAHTITKSSGIVAADYLSLRDSIATGGATFIAGRNSTFVSNVTGWLAVAYFQDTFVEAVTIVDVSEKGFSKTLTEIVAVNDALENQFTLTLQETLGVSDRLSNEFSQILTEKITIAESLLNKLKWYKRRPKNWYTDQDRS